MEINVIEKAIGKTIKDVFLKEDIVAFLFDDETGLSMHHYQGCCEEVFVSDVCGI